jgi:hypothetical protein
MIVGHVKVNRTSILKSNMKTEHSNNTMEKMNLTDISITSTHSSRMHLLFKHTWNFLQNRSHVRSLNET